MLKTMRASLLLAALGAFGVALVACSGGVATTIDQPQEKGEITSPTSGLKITASIAAVSLGDECGGNSCQNTNVQLAFDATTGTNPAVIRVISATLVDSADGSAVDTLTVSTPQVWNGNGYVAWDQNVKPGGDLKASYDLTSPAWSKIDGNGTGSRLSGSGSYSRKFKLNLKLEIDGVQVILQSTDLNRMPQSAT